jgi:hypothetical protein
MIQILVELSCRGGPNVDLAKGSRKMKMGCLDRIKGMP